jgi:uncharacterized protein (TIGR02722 family)
MNRLPFIAVSALAAVLLVPIFSGCQPKAVRGGAGTENPNLDEAAMSTGLDRKDLEYLMRENMGKLFASPLWNQFKTAGSQPVVAIWPIKNDTTEHLDDQLNTLLSDMETEFINSGVVSVVSRERQDEMAREVGVQQQGVFDPAKAAQFGKQIGAHYFVTGKVQAVDERMKGERRVQYSLFMQVIEVETSLVKFQAKTERTKAIVR